ncbi:MAG TPA: glycosyltransferase [Tepidisphaeraceae bacterium]|nr:glycosyltransferase [Tepidisphaeraceae bacterium]
MPLRMVENPLISVVMPVYNARRYLAEAVESILAQTLGDFEIVCVDDGSTDDSLAILNDCAKRDARIRIISRPNTGVWKALNDGIQASRGRLIARMDADDVSLPTRFEKQVAFLNQNLDVVAVGCPVLLIDADGAPLREMPDPPRWTHEEIDAAHLTGGGQVFYHPTLIFRRDALEKVGLYRDWPAAQDLDLFLRLAEIGKLANVRDVLLKYRQHMGSVGHAKMLRQLETCREIVRQAYERRGLTPAGSIGFERVRQMSETEQHRKWAWWALAGGHLTSARKHARKALRKSPFSSESWRVMYCSLRGR